MPDLGEVKSKGRTNSPETRMVHDVNTAVSRHLVRVMGSGALETINFHLRRLVDTDLTSVGSEPKLVERGLRQLFGPGAQVIIEASIVGAFRSAHIVPERDFISLEEAMFELFARTSTRNTKSVKNDA